MSDPVPSILDLLPHRPPMGMLDRLIDSDAQGMRCAATIRPGNLFLRDGVLEPAALIEYMAQAMAAHVCLKSGSPKPQMGYLVAVRDMEMPAVGPALGADLVIEVIEQGVMGDFASYDGKVIVDEKVVCQGNLKVFRLREDAT
jgi:predicted hotdog family 3-hydroxylacyl-ACP dehydratase